VNLSFNDKQLIQQFFTNKPVKKAYLFGSYARNTALKGSSDIDILVELDYSRQIGLDFIQMIFDLEELLKAKVDLVTTDGLSKHAKPFVDKDKILLYERAA
jgi:predicted nucleotidyltransferase